MPSLPAVSPVSRTLATLDYGGRMALKLETLVDELILTLRELRPLIAHLQEPREVEPAPVTALSTAKKRKAVAAAVEPEPELDLDQLLFEA